MRTSYKASTQEGSELEPVIIMARPVDRKGGMRLNNEMKVQVIDKAMSHAFDKRQEAMLKEEQAISKLLWLGSGHRAIPPFEGG